jgi:hypothetical protein
VKQFNVGLPEPLRAALNKAAERNGRSLAEEIRVRLESSSQGDQAEEPDKALLTAISNLIAYVQRQTGWSWSRHPFAFEVFRHALTTLLDRVQPRDTPTGEPPHKPTMIVASSDTAAIGMGLETLASMAFLPSVFGGGFGPHGYLDLATARQKLIEAEADKEAEKANRKIRRRGKRGRS